MCAAGLALGVLALPALLDDGRGGAAGMVGVAHAQSGFRLAVVDSALKVRPGDVALVRDNGPALIELAAARNEYESAQIVLASDTPVEGLTAEITPLVGPGATIPGVDIELLLVQSVNVEVASDARGAVGEWPDALVPLRRAF